MRYPDPGDSTRLQPLSDILSNASIQVSIKLPVPCTLGAGVSLSPLASNGTLGLPNQKGQVPAGGSAVPLPPIQSYLSPAACQRTGGAVLPNETHKRAKNPELTSTWCIRSFNFLSNMVLVKLPHPSWIPADT